MILLRKKIELEKEGKKEKDKKSNSRALKWDVNYDKLGD